MIQSILLIAQTAPAASIARRLFGSGVVEFIAAIIVALYPFFLFYQALLLSETLFNTLLIAAIAALYWWRDRGMRIDVALVVTCLCFVAATYTKASLTILPPRSSRRHGQAARVCEKCLPFSSPRQVSMPLS